MVNLKWFLFVLLFARFVELNMSQLCDCEDAFLEWYAKPRTKMESDFCRLNNFSPEALGFYAGYKAGIDKSKKVNNERRF